MSSLLLGVTGLPGTGKSTVGKHLEKEHGFFTLEGSQALRERASKIHRLPLVERRDYAKLFREEQERLGFDWITQRVIQNSSERKAHIGMRSSFEAETIRANGGVIIATTCSISTALNRVHPNDSKMPDSPKKYIEHIDVDSSPTEYGAHILNVIAIADYRINTEGMLADTHQQIDDLLARL